MADSLQTLLTRLHLDHPTLIAGLSSLLTLTPSSSPLFALLTLPSVLHHGASDQSPPGVSEIVKRALALATGSTAGSVLGTRGILPSAMEQGFAQAFFSLVIALITGLVVVVQTKVVEGGIIEDSEDWIASPLFGLVWAGTWLMWSRISPFGRYGVPCPDDLELFRRVLAYLGPTGVDFLIGTAGHVASKTFQAERVRRISNEGDTRGSPSHGSHSDAERLTTASDTSTRQRETPRTTADLDLPSRGRPPTARVEHERRQATKDMQRATTITVNPGNEQLPWKGPRKLGYALTTLFGALTTFPARPTRQLSDPINKVTPLSVGCVIPPSPHPDLDEVILALRQFGTRAQLLVLPETALSLRWEGERAFVLDRILEEVAEQCGTWIVVSMESPAAGHKHMNEVALVGPHGIVGAYAKRSLFPLVESTRFHKATDAPPVWTLNISHPHGTTKPEWSTIPPFFRHVEFSPLICLDALHPDLVSTETALASFLIIPAASQPILAKQVIRHAQVLSSTHGIPSIVCSRGISAAIDETGGLSHQQAGGRGFVATLAIPWYGDWDKRQLTLPETLGSGGVLGLLALCTVLFKALEVYRRKGTAGIEKGVTRTAGRLEHGCGKIKGLITWRKRDDQAERLPLQSSSDSRAYRTGPSSVDQQELQQCLEERNRPVKMPDQPGADLLTPKIDEEWGVGMRGDTPLRPAISMVNLMDQ